MEVLKSSYSFDGQIRYLNDLCKTNVFLAETVNSILPNVPKTALAQIIEELKLQYFEIYQDDAELLSSVNVALNVLSRDHVTDIDRLFLNLAEDINAFYAKPHIVVTKSVPFSKCCRVCQKPVANDTVGLKWHTESCKSQKIHRHQLIRRKCLDTPQKYEERQNRVPLPLPEVIQFFGEEDECIAPPKPSKKQKLQRKKREKLKEIDCLSFINDFLLQKPKPKEEEEVEIFHEREDEPQDETLRLQLMMRPPTQDVAKVDKEAPTNLDIFYENESNQFFS